MRCIGEKDQKMEGFVAPRRLRLKRFWKNAFALVESWILENEIFGRGSLQLVTDGGSHQTFAPMVL